ncbi:thioredoxin-like protein [Lipomyces arxii]|uniref:mitochondrial 54S ribosomal protein mL43 n=1 Tax=Lipomyces arxii TaxID=56418 RepID=UPI0034CEE20E
MTVAAVRRGISVARNGVGAFVLPCKKITFQYCNSGGSSLGIRKYLNDALGKFARENRGVEIEVKIKSGHPLITGNYMNGKQKVICVRNMTTAEINDKVRIIRDASGYKLKRMVNPVHSENEGPRGVWSPFHVLAKYRHKI